MSRSIDDLPDIITADDIKEVLNICYSNALKVIRFGKLRHFKLGNQYRITKKDFVEWLYHSKSTTIDFE